MLSNYAKIIKEVCKEENIELTSFSHDWIFMMKKGDKLRYILAYQFDLNTAATQAVLNDKSATSDILTFSDIPCVEHSIFMSAVSGYCPKGGNFVQLHKLLEQFGRLVCKPNEGSSGTDVYAVVSGAELEEAVEKIFAKSGSMAVSAYYEIEKEFRIIVLDGEVKLVFSKEIPFVKGDGVSTLAQIVASSPRYYELCQNELGRVLEDGEVFKLGWKHNLAHGAIPSIVTDEDVFADLSALALRAAKVLNIRFASVDIVLSGDEYRILEINSGVMMEHFASSSAHNYEKAKEIYGEAIRRMFI